MAQSILGDGPQALIMDSQEEREVDKKFTKVEGQGILGPGTSGANESHRREKRPF